MAVLFCLLAFQKHLKGNHVLIRSDNTTAVAYIQNKGGPILYLSEIAKSIWAFAYQHNFSITCRHLAGVENTTADYLSRSPDKHNWSLHPDFFALIDSLYGKHTIDRFATLNNTQLERFNSRYLTPGTEAVDAMSQNWSEENNYINPPWVMLPQIIEKIIADRAYATVIAPIFNNQPWFHALRAISTRPPLLLPRDRNAIQYTHSVEPNRNLGWKIAVWRVYGGRH